MQAQLFIANFLKYTKFAEVDKTPQGKPLVTQEEIDLVLSGDLNNPKVAKILNKLN